MHVEQVQWAREALLPSPSLAQQQLQKRTVAAHSSAGLIACDSHAVNLNQDSATATLLAFLAHPNTLQLHLAAAETAGHPDCYPAKQYNSLDTMIGVKSKGGDRMAAEHHTSLCGGDRVTSRS